jgi:hypothetical protein
MHSERRTMKRRDRHVASKHPVDPPTQPIELPIELRQAEHVGAADDERVPARETFVYGMLAGTKTACSS